MQLITFLTEQTIICNVHCSSKKRILELISELLAEQLAISPALIFDALCSRERVGSTGIGSGIALPHGKLENEILPKARGVFVQLENAIAYDAPDNQPVDLLFALLIPEQHCQDYKDTLQNIAELLSDKVLCRQLRATRNHTALCQLLFQDIKSTIEEVDFNFISPRL